MTVPDRELIRDALSGRRDATRRLVSRLRPVVQAEVGHLLMSCAPARGRSARQEVEDLVQDVFMHLWANKGKLLRQWAPERGRSLDSWVRLVASSRALDVLRSQRRNPWSDEPTPSEDLEQQMTDETLRSALAARETLARLEQRLREQLSDRDWLLFLALHVEQAPVRDVARQTGMTPDAIYQWRSRFTRNVLAGLEVELSDNPAEGAG